MISPIGITEHFISFSTLVCETVSLVLFVGSFITLGPVIVTGDVVIVDKLPSELKNNDPPLELEELLLELEGEKPPLELDEMLLEPEEEDEVKQSAKSIQVP